MKDSSKQCLNKFLLLPTAKVKSTQDAETLAKALKTDPELNCHT